MPHYTIPDCSAIPALVNHEGGNISRFAKHIVTEALSASISLAMIPLPGGARIVDISVMNSNNVPVASSAEAVTLSVHDGFGNQWVASATAQAATGVIRYSPSSYLLHGYRLTSSTNLYLRINPGDSPVESTTFAMCVTYDTRKMPD